MGLCRTIVLCALVSACASADVDDTGDAGGRGSQLPACEDGDPDSDGDGVCDARDLCVDFDDSIDADDDGIPDACDVCDGFHDGIDDDEDGVPNGCDVCPDDPSNVDDDGDGVCNASDPCPDDAGDDTDGDGVCDSEDPCPVDNPDDDDGDTVCNSADVCPIGNDLLDGNGNAIPDACDCIDAFEVRLNDICYYLDGVNGNCGSDAVIAPQSVLNTIAPQFAGKTYKTTVSNNCCVKHADQAAEGQDYGMDFNTGDCNQPGTFTQGPILGGTGCTNANQNNSAQLTLCQRDPLAP